jgi:RHS repeat-associated protein
MSRYLFFGTLTVLLFLLACGGGGPSNSTATAGLPDTCPDVATVPCQFRAATASIPIVGTHLSLNYTSIRQPGRKIAPSDPDATDVGGWNISLVDRLNVSDGLFLGGDGTRRRVQPISLGDQLVVASPDASTTDVFDKKGRELKRIDGFTKLDLARFAYDGDNLKSITDANGTTTLERDFSGSITAIVAPLGARTELTLADGALSSALDQAGRGNRMSYGDGRLLTNWTNPNGAPTQFTYDANGLLATSIDGDGVKTTYDQTLSDGAVTVTASREGGVTTSWSTAKIEGGWRYAVTASGLTRSADVVAGARHLTLPDGSHADVTLTPDPQWGDQSPVVSAHITTPGNKVSDESESRPSPGGDLLTPVAVTRTLTIDGSVTEERFAADARTVTTKSPEGRLSSVTLGNFERVEASHRPGEAPTQYGFDERGLLTTVTEGNGADSRVYQINWDVDTGEAKVTNPKGDVSSLAFDAAGSLVAVNRADGKRAVIDRTAAGQPAGISVDGVAQYTIGTNERGQLTTFAPVDGASLDVTTLGYTNGRVTNQSNPDGTSVTVQYDDHGRLSSVDAGAGAYAPTYADNGTIAAWKLPLNEAESYTRDGDVVTAIALTGPVGGKLSVETSALGALSSYTAGDTKVPVTYDKDGTLTSIGGVQITPDPANGLQASTTAGALTTTTAYDSYDAFKSLTANTGSNAAFSDTVGRDSLGRAATEDISSGGSSSAFTYSYDSAGRLAEVVHDGQPSTLSYDRFDNLIGISGAQNVTFTLDNRGQVTSDGTSTYEWSAAGTLGAITTGGARTVLSYDGFGRPVGAQTASGQHVQYLYNAEGQRIGRTVGGQLAEGFLYPPKGTQPFAQVDSQGHVVATFVYDAPGAPAEIIKGSQKYRVIADRLGSPRLVLDESSGQVVEQIDYDVFGRVISDSNPGFQPFGFTGGLADPTTGFVHLGVRDYDPVIARWTTRDPALLAGGQTNLLAYARNDWPNLTDRDGRTSLDEIADIENAISAYLGAAGNLAGVLGSDLGATAGLGALVEAGAAGSKFLPGLGALLGAADAAAAIANIAQKGANAGNLGDLFSGLGGLLAGLAPFAGPTPLAAGLLAAGLAFTAIGFGFKAAALAHGDPHFDSLDGNLFDFQGAGEFTIAREPGGGFEVQARQEPASGSRVVSVLTAIAIGLNGGHRVGVYRGQTPELLVDGAPLDLPVGSYRIADAGTVSRLPGGEYLVRTPDGLSGVKIATGIGDSIVIQIAVDNERGKAMQGLFGSKDGNPSNDFTRSDGTTLANPDFTAIHRQFGESWRITQAESLFDYAAGQSTDTYTDKTFPDREATVDDVPANVRPQARAICAGAGITNETVLKSCVLDVGLTRDPSFALQAIPANRTAVAAGSTQQLGGTRQTFQIQPGDSVSKGSPGEGAGNIGKAGEVDVYSIAGGSGDAIYLAASPGCQLKGLQWQVRGPDGRQTGGVPDVCLDIGRVVFDQAGTWTIEVFGRAGETGDYGFSVLASEADQTFTIGADTNVSNDNPSSGAGNIDKPGGRDLYQLKGSAGDAVYIGALPGCSTSDIVWSLRSPTGGAGGIVSVCQDLGVVRFDSDGSATVVVTGQGGGTGRYSFRTQRSEPVQTFQVSLPFGVSADQPTAGAGRIDRPGGEDDYQFQGVSGQTITLTASGKCTVTGATWELHAPDGSERGGILDVCSDIGAQTLDADGTWTIVVRAAAGTGAYAFDVATP